MRSRETHLGRLASDSTLWVTRQTFPDIAVDVALKNGGGIRDTILAVSKKPSLGLWRGKSGLPVVI